MIKSEIKEKNKENVIRKSKYVNIGNYFKY